MASDTITIQTLQDLSAALQSSLSLGDVLHSIVANAVSVLGYRVALLTVVEEKSNVLVMRAMSVAPDLIELGDPLVEGLLQDIRIPLDQMESLVVRAVREGRVVVTNSLYDLFQPIVDPTAARSIQQVLQSYGLVAVPLLARGQLVGGLVVGSTHEESSEHELSLLSVLGSQAALAVQNAQLCEMQRERTAQFESIRELGQRIAPVLSRDELPRHIVELIWQRFGYGHVGIVLKDRNKSVFRLEALIPPEPGLAEVIVPFGQENGQAGGKSGTVSWVIHNGQSLLIDDVEREEGYASWWESGSELVVPISLGDQVLGVLDVHQGEANGFDEQDTFVLESLSNQIAVAIENAQLYNTVNQRLDEVYILYMLANQASSSLDLDVVLDLVVSILRRVLSCRASVIFLLDEKREELIMRASSGVKPQWQRDARMRLGEGLAGKVAQEAKSLYIPDTYQDPNFVVFDPAVRSMLIVPLIYQGEVIGTLNVDDNKPDAFSEDLSRLLSIAAAQAAAAIYHAQLHEALKERAEKLAQAHKSLAQAHERLALAHEELIESDRLKSEFVQNTSHELRTPLTFVKGYAELLLEGTLGPLNDQQQESLQVVADWTDRIIQLVNNILALQEVERGELRFSSLSMAKVARSSLRSADATARQAGISLVEDFEPDLRPVWGDRTRLERVFVNLIGNAIKFSPDGGTITVRLRNEEGSVRADVIDQGIGIAQDKLARVFERFYQVNGSSKRRFGGTGLGLAIVKEIVEAHSGTVSVQSQKGIGSTFSFTVPVAPDETG